MIRKVVKWVLIGCLVLQLARVIQGRMNSGCSYRKWSRPGTLKLLVIAGIHGNDNGGCGDISTTNFALLTALDWILDIVNGNGSAPFLPSMTIGYDLYDNCDDEDLTVDLMYPGFTGISNVCESQSSNTSEEIYTGLFSVTTAEASRRITKLAGSLPVFRTLAPVPGLNSHLYPNLIQTVADFDDEAEALVQLLVQMKWNFIFLVHTDDEYGTLTRDMFSAKSRENEICIHLVQKLLIKYAKDSEITASAESIINEVYKQILKGYNKSIVIVYLGYGRGAKYLLEAVKKEYVKPIGSKISWIFSQGVGADVRVTGTADFSQTYGLSVSHRPLVHDDFKDYLMKVLQDKTDTPYSGLKSEYLSAISCDSSSVDTCQNLQRTNFDFLSSFIDSVLLNVVMLSDLHNAICQTGGVCDRMKEMLLDKIWYSFPSQISFKKELNGTYLPKEYQSQGRNLSFTPSGHVALNSDLPLEIHKLPDSSNTIGIFDGVQMKLEKDVSSFPTSACNRPADCPLCRQYYDLRYSYLHGDLLLLGLFSIHQYGDTPFQCGPLRHDTNDAITVSAFMESIISLRKETGINYGGIAIDDCYSPLNTSAFLSNLFGKKMFLRDRYTSEIIDFDKVFVIIGALSSPVSLLIGDLSTGIGVPMTSYGASSQELDNDARYPFFLRTVPSDTRQVKGIIQLIQSLNVTFVGALYIDDAYGKNGIKALSEEAKRVGICIDKPVAIQQDIDNTTLSNIVTSLYVRGTRVIIYFSIDSLALRILEILSASFSDRQPLVFIASEGWGTNQNILEGQLGKRAKGSIVFNVETITQNNEDFKNFLNNLTPSHVENNRWISNFFEDVHKCDFISSFDKSRSTNIAPCDPLLTLDKVTVDSLYQDQRSVHVINAVKASINGFSKVADKICKSMTVCKELRSVSNARSLKEAIQSINIGDAQRDVFPFDAIGSGNIGFTIFNIQRNEDRITYVKIGSFSKENKLTLTSPPIFYNDLQQPTTLGEMFPENIHCSYFSDVCSNVCQVSTGPTQPVTQASTEAMTEYKGNESSILIITVVLAVLLAVVVLAFVVVICLLLRRHTQQGSDETFTKSESLNASKFPSSNNIYNEVSDYQGTHPRSHFSRTSGLGSISAFSEGPVTYSDIRQTHLIGSHMFSYPDTKSEILSPMSTKSLSPGMVRPSKPVVVHTRSLSDSKINRVDAALGEQMLSDVMANHMLPSTRSKGLENLHEVRSDSQIHTIGNNRDSIRGSYDDSDPDDYVDPDQGSRSHEDFHSNSEGLTYITAKDLINHSDEEESFGEESETSSNNNPHFTEHSGAAVAQMKHEPYNSNLISPSDQEIMAINFPGHDSVTFKNKRQLSKTPELYEEDRNIDIAKEKTNTIRTQQPRTRNLPAVSENRRNQSKSSMSSVPDIIPFDGDEPLATTPDSDEQEVFII